MKWLLLLAAPVWASSNKAVPPLPKAVAPVPVVTAASQAVPQTPALQSVDYTAQQLEQAQTSNQDVKPVLDRAFELSSANPVSARTAAESGAPVIVLSAARAQRGQLSAVVNAVRHTQTKVYGRFNRHDDPYLKPKIDEGLHGAILEAAESLKHVVKFLKRLYLPPLGERTVGPSDVTGYLRRAKEFISGENQRFEGGIQIDTQKGVDELGRLLTAKKKGLKFVELGPNLSRPQQDAVRSAAAQAGLEVRERPRTDLQAVHAALDAYADVPADPSKEPRPGSSMREWLNEGRIGQLGFLNSVDAPIARVFSDKTSAVWLDAEAGHFTARKVAAVIASLPPGRPAAVRAADWNDPDIAAYVAAGAQAVVAPTVGTASQARAFVAAVKRANPSALAIVMIETRQGLENVEEISRVPGVDLLFVGPNDLALSLRTTQDSPAFADALEKIERAAASARLPLGGLVKSRSQAYALHARGYRFVITVMEQTAIAKDISHG